MEGCNLLAQAYGKYETSLDILVNNAGAAWLAEFDSFPEAGWDKVMNLKELNEIKKITMEINILNM